MGPRKAATQYRKLHPEATGFRVTLYGALAATGKESLSDTQKKIRYCSAK